MAQSRVTQTRNVAAVGLAPAGRAVAVQPEALEVSFAAHALLRIGGRIFPADEATARARRGLSIGSAGRQAIAMVERSEFQPELARRKCLFKTAVIRKSPQKSNTCEKFPRQMRMPRLGGNSWSRRGGCDFSSYAKPQNGQSVVQPLRGVVPTLKQPAISPRANITTCSTCGAPLYVWDVRPIFPRRKSIWFRSSRCAIMKATRWSGRSVARVNRVGADAGAKQRVGGHSC